MKKKVTRLCRLGVCGTSVLAGMLMFANHLGVLPGDTREGASTSQEKKAVGSFTQMRADRVKLFRNKLPAAKAKILGDIPRIYCNSENEHVPCIAVPPLSAKELHENTIDFNIERTFTFSGNLDNRRLSELPEKVNARTTPINSTIPRIIHLIWTNATIPSVFVDNVKSFLLHHPGWTFYFWTYSHGRAFIEDHYPELLTTFDDYRKDVSRSDLLRFALMHHYGGAYFDLDTTCLRPLDAIVDQETCVLSPEPVEHAVFVTHIPSLLNSCVLMCRPGHKLYEFLLSQLPLAKNRSMMSAAGPVFLTKVVNFFLAKQHSLQLSENDTIHIVSNELFLGRIKPNVERKLNSICSVTNLQTHLKRRMCDHWKRRDKRSKMIAFTDHQYFGTYNKLQLLRFEPQNHFRNLIPGVKEYTSEAPDFNIHAFRILAMCLVFVAFRRCYSTRT